MRPECHALVFRILPLTGFTHFEYVLQILQKFCKICKTLPNFAKLCFLRFCLSHQVQREQRYALRTRRHDVLSYAMHVLPLLIQISYQYASTTPSLYAVDDISIRYVSVHMPTCHQCPINTLINSLSMRCVLLSYRHAINVPSTYYQPAMDSILTAYRNTIDIIHRISTAHPHHDDAFTPR